MVFKPSWDGPRVNTPEGVRLCGEYDRDRERDLERSDRSLSVDVDSDLDLDRDLDRSRSVDRLLLRPRLSSYSVSE